MMVFPRIRQLGAVLLFIGGIAAATFAQAARGPATPDEIARVVQLAQVSDKDPLAAMASTEGRWFQKWVEEVPDYSFGPDKGASWLGSGAAKGDLKRVLRFHHTVSTAAHQVQHNITDPDKDSEASEATTLAGVEGLLRAYESLVAKRAENRSEQVDLAVAARDKGTLAAFVKALPPMPGR